MNHDDGITTTAEIPSDDFARPTKGDRVAGWLLTRLASTASWAYLTAFAAAVVHLSCEYWLIPRRLHWPYRWFLEPNLDVLWPRIWGAGAMFGLLLPKFQLPQQWRPKLYGGLIGMPLLLMIMGVADRIFTEIAINVEQVRVQEAGYMNFRRPLPNQKGYPSLYRAVYIFTVPAGLIIGTLVGTGIAAKGQRRRAYVTAGLATTIACAVGFGVYSYFAHAQSIQRRLEW